MDAAEGEIDAAYTAVNNAEIALRQVTGALEIAEKALADCLDQWVLGDCLASAIQICDDTYALASDTYTQRRAACYQEAMAECDRQRDEAIDACYAAHADAIESAQKAVDEAARDVELATNGRYHPAAPLILEVPVAHCGAGQYKVDDEVLIDFPVRSGETAMAVWDSRRVIGWATDTQTCCCGGMNYEKNSTVLFWEMGRYHSDTPYFLWGNGIPPQNDAIECGAEAVLSHTNWGEYPYAWFIFSPQIIDEYTPCEFEVKGEISGPGEFYFNEYSYSDTPGGVNVIFSGSFGWTKVCFNRVRAAPSLILYCPSGRSVKVWVRNAKGHHEGFCAITGQDLAALENEYQRLVADVETTGAASQAARAAYYACRAACGYNEATAACAQAYPYGACLWECSKLVFGVGDWEAAQAECRADCRDTYGVPNSDVDSLALFEECMEPTFDCLDACDAVHEPLMAAATAANNAAVDALHAFLAGHPC